MFFTSDTHFGHPNVIIYDRRPFKAANCSCIPKTDTERGRGCRACADLMDSVIIDNWNSVVGPKDDVWHLGDFCYRNEKPAEWYLKQLKGRIHIIFGNHDKEAKLIAGKFASYYGSLSKEKGPSYSCAVELKFNHQLIIMSHYSARTWLSSHRGAWHLFGHSHGSLPNMNKSMDVGVNSHGYAPVSFDKVKAYMDAQPTTNHHPGRDEK